MKAILIVACVLAVVLIGVALYSVSKQSVIMDGYSQDLKEQIQQAQDMKKDLEDMMQDVVSAGKVLIDDLDARRADIKQENSNNLPLSKPPVTLSDKPALEAAKLQTEEIAKLLKYQSNPADEVAIENINLKYLPEIVEIIEVETNPTSFEQYDDENVDNIEKTNKELVDETEKEKAPIVSEIITDKALIKDETVNGKANKDYFAAGRIRAYELAEELGMSNKEFVNAAQAQGFLVNHHMNLLTNEEAERIRIRLTEKKDVSEPPVINKIIWSEFSYLPPIGEMPPLELAEKDETGFAEEKKAEEKTSAATKIPDPVHEKSMVFLPSYGDQPSIFAEKTEELQTIEEQYQQELKSAHPYIAVKALTEQGYSVKEIARVLDRSQGEIELIQNINIKKNVV